MRALIIDKFEICRSGFKSILESNFENAIVCEAGTIEEALSCMDDHGSDIVILTVEERIDATDPAFLRLRKFASDTPIVVVGNAVNRELVLDTFRHNIRGFFDRSNNKAIVIAAIKLILAGGKYFPPEVHSMIGGTSIQGINEVNQPVENAGRLTSRQRQVLRAVSEGKSNKMIAEDLGISAGTVKVHISNLMKDLQAKNRTQAVSIANNLKIL